MKGVIIWAQSDCRSTMGLYESLIKLLDIPVVVALWFFLKDKAGQDNRTAIGFCHDEFRHIPTVRVGENYAKGLQLLDEHQGFLHVFTVYQGSSVWRQLIREAKRRGERVIIACESPCNMFSGFKWLTKEIYLRLFLRWKIRSVVKAADVFINYKSFHLVEHWAVCNVAVYAVNFTKSNHFQRRIDFFHCSDLHW